MPQLQAIWNQFNPRERLSAIGAGLIILGWIVGLTTLYGIGSSAISLLGAIAVLVIFYLKYAPNQNITWPAPVSLIILAITGIVGVIELLHLLQWLSFIGSAGVSLILALGLSVAGAAIMLWGAWQEYQIVKPAMPNFGATTTPTTPPPAATPPPVAPAAPAADPAAPPADNTDEAPPA